MGLFLCLMYTVLTTGGTGQFALQYVELASSLGCGLFTRNLQHALDVVLYWIKKPSWRVAISVNLLPDLMKLLDLT